MKSLFNKYEAYNEVGRIVNDEIQKALEPIIAKWAFKGYSIIDIESVAISSIITIDCILRLEKSMRMIKQEKNGPLG